MFIYLEIVTQKSTGNKTYYSCLQISSKLSIISTDCLHALEVWIWKTACFLIYKSMHVAHVKVICKTSFTIEQLMLEVYSILYRAVNTDSWLCLHALFAKT